MKIMHEQVDLSLSPIKVKWDDFPHFSYPWHFHSEYEIVFVRNGGGIRYVADNIASFKNDDLVLLGSQLPHFWRSAPEYYLEESSLRVNAVVVQFSADFLNHAMQHYPELQNIKHLLTKANRGVKFGPPQSKKIGAELQNLLHISGFERFVKLLQILNQLAVCKNFTLLATEGFAGAPMSISEDRLNKLINYISYNYQKTMQINELADKFGMHPASLCRYFKEKTSKSIVRFIHEMRVGYACRLLTNNKMTVSQIAYECGFNNISNFNRSFKNITGFSPMEYKRQIKGEDISY